jgi:hypothetical protein
VKGEVGNLEEGIFTMIRIHGSKEIDWNYYREWFVSDQAGMQEALRGTNRVKNHIAAKVTWNWAMENGVPMDVGGVGKVPVVTKSKSTTFKSLFGCNCFTAGTKWTVNTKLDRFLKCFLFVNEWTQIPQCRVNSCFVKPFHVCP